MSFASFTEQEDAVQLLQRSLARERLGHAYLFSGDDLERLQLVARTLAKTLNCQNPRQSKTVPGAPDCCDACLSCRKIDAFNHADVQWIRPESKSRVITIDQMRDLMQTVHLKPTVAAFKFGMIVAADRLNVQAANAFLKTLEEPPPNSVLVLLSTEPQRILETILSCSAPKTAQKREAFRQVLSRLQVGFEHNLSIKTLKKLVQLDVL